MKKTIIQTTEVDEHYQWEILVDRSDIKLVCWLLVDQSCYGFEVLDDRGGSGTWRIKFHPDHDKPEIAKMLALVTNLFQWQDDE